MALPPQYLVLPVALYLSPAIYCTGSKIPLILQCLHERSQNTRVLVAWESPKEGHLYRLLQPVPGTYFKALFELFLS